MFSAIASFIGPLTLRTLFPGALKAHISGVATMLGADMVGACDFETIAQQWGSRAGAYLMGYLVTWLVPNLRFGRFDR